MKIKMRKIDLYITIPQYEVLKNKSVEKGITFSEVLRKIIDAYEDKNEKSNISETKTTNF